MGETELHQALTDIISLNPPNAQRTYTAPQQELQVPKVSGQAGWGWDTSSTDWDSDAFAFQSKHRTVFPSSHL